MKLLKKILIIPLVGFGLLSSCQCSTFIDSEVEDNSPKGDNNHEFDSQPVSPNVEREETTPTPGGNGDNEPEEISITFDRFERIIHVLVPSSDAAYNSLTSYHSNSLNKDFAISLKKNVFAVAHPSTATLSYESTDLSVATVDGYGIVTGLKPNATCDIIVTSSSGVKETIPVKTYTEENYFEYETKKVAYYETQDIDSGYIVNDEPFIYKDCHVNVDIDAMTITNCVDKDIEELILPTKKPSTNDFIRGVSVSAFNKARKLRKLVVPDGYYNLGRQNFIGATQLTDLHIPSSLFDAGFFYGNFVSSKNSLKNVTLDYSNIYYDLDHYNNDPYSGYFVYIYKDINKYVDKHYDYFQYAYGNVDGTKIFDTTKYPYIERLTANCLSGLDSLIHLVIPSLSNLHSIGAVKDDAANFFSSAVNNCKNLESVTIANQLFFFSSMSEFSNCPKLETFNIDPICKNLTTKDDNGNETHSLIFAPATSEQDWFVNNSKRTANDERVVSGTNYDSPKAYVIRGTKNSTFKDNATYKGRTKLGFNSGSFVGVNYSKGILKLPSNTTSIGWGAFYYFNADGVFLPKNSYFTNGQEGKYGSYLSVDNEHKVTYYGNILTNRYYEPTYIDNNIVDLPDMNTDLEQTNPCCFWCKRSFKVYVENLNSHPYKNQLKTSASFDVKDNFTYTVEQKSPNQI